MEHLNQQRLDETKKKVDYCNLRHSSVICYLFNQSGLSVCYLSVVSCVSTGNQDNSSPSTVVPSHKVPPCPYGVYIYECRLLSTFINVDLYEFYFYFCLDKVVPTTSETG